MRYLLSLILICCTILLQAQSIKLKYEAKVKSCTFKVEKIKVENNQTLVFLKIKQRQNFSYSISFAECSISTPSAPDGVKGVLKGWNDEEKIWRDTKTISDQDWEECTLAFPSTDILNSQQIDLMVGRILDRDKTEILFKGISLKKK